jgi:hypothetical protein
MNARFWFHCSNDDNGERWSLRPRRPSPLRYGVAEPLTPRLCVAPTIASCFAATLFDMDKPVYVYRTATTRRGVKPVKVWDQPITGERWIVDRVEMVRIETISAALADQVNDPIRFYHMRQPNKGTGVKLRVAQLAHAINVLGDKRSSRLEKQWLAKWLKRLGIVDAEEYIIERACQQ